MNLELKKSFKKLKQLLMRRKITKKKKIYLLRLCPPEIHQCLEMIQEYWNYMKSNHYQLKPSRKKEVPEGQGITLHMESMKQLFKLK
jgi:hypothetical protein